MINWINWRIYEVIDKIHSSCLAMGFFLITGIREVGELLKWYQPTWSILYKRGILYRIENNFLFKTSTSVQAGRTNQIVLTVVLYVFLQLCNVRSFSVAPLIFDWFCPGIWVVSACAAQVQEAAEGKRTEDAALHTNQQLTKGVYSCTFTFTHEHFIQTNWMLTASCHIGLQWWIQSVRRSR